MIKGKMKLFCLRVGLLQRGRQNLTSFSNFSQIGLTVFETLPLKDSLYFIVFANILIKENRQNMLIRYNFF